MEEIFKEALNLTLIFEGGYVNDIDDPGGETNFGILSKEYDKYRKLKNLPISSIKEIEKNEIEEIYYTNYWIKGNCDKFSKKLSILHFDTCVNVGISQANKFLQRSLSVIADGFIGPQTIKKYKEVKDNSGLDNLINNYIAQRKSFYYKLAEKNSKLNKFLKGWLNRVNKLENYIKGV